MGLGYAAYIDMLMELLMSGDILAGVSLGQRPIGGN